MIGPLFRFLGQCSIFALFLAGVFYGLPIAVAMIRLATNN